MNSNNTSANCQPKPTEKELWESVRDYYAQIVSTGKSGLNDNCGAFNCNKLREYAQKLGYNQNDLSEVPKHSNLGLGCGNPGLIAAIKLGEAVLDLGCGAGIDAFIAAKAVGATGRVVGVDMTPEMISRARRISLPTGLKNVEFRLGQIEDLPIDSSSIDVIISNCTINLVPNKAKTFQELYRVLRPGGRLAISDVVARVELPESFQTDRDLYVQCVSGAALVMDLEKFLKNSGFVNINIAPIEESRQFIKDWALGMQLDRFLVSANIQAYKQ